MKRSKKQNIDKMLVFCLIWLIVSVVYWIYVHFYRIPMVIAGVLAIVYVVVSYILLTQSTLPQKNVKIMLLCTFVIMLMINSINIMNWYVEEIQKQEYYSYLETKPDNILLKRYTEENP